MKAPQPCLSHRFVMMRLTLALQTSLWCIPVLSGTLRQVRATDCRGYTQEIHPELRQTRQECLCVIHPLVFSLKFLTFPSWPARRPADRFEASRREVSWGLALSVLDRWQTFRRLAFLMASCFPAGEETLVLIMRACSQVIPSLLNLLSYFYHLQVEKECSWVLLRYVCL